MHRSYGVWEWFLPMKVTISVAISRRFSKECFLIVKLLQGSHWIKQRVDTMFYMVAPEFKRVLLYDVKSLPFFTVSFDESLNTDIQICQMDVAVRFWNEKTGLAGTKYFNTQFLRRPTAENLLDGLYESMNELEKNKLLQLAWNGPNVNWNILDLLDDKLVSDNFSKTLNIGSCAQHTVHGSLENGFQKSTWNMDSCWNLSFRFCMILLRDVMFIYICGLNF